MEIAMALVDEEKARTAMMRFRDLQSENVPVIGIGVVYLVWRANRRLGNVPKKIFQFNYALGAAQSFMTAFR